MSADAGGSRPTGSERAARVIAVQEDLVTIAHAGAAGGARFIKNEVALIRSSRSGEAHLNLKGEVLRIRGGEADVQVYESTAGVAVGDSVRLTGAPLSALLGPGVLGQVYDGLQAPLEPLALDHGVFLPRGVAAPALPPTMTWPFHPLVRAEAEVRAGDPIGWVEEGPIRHIIAAPFDLVGKARVLWIEEASFTVADTIGELSEPGGARRPLRLAQPWPVRRPLAPAGTRRLYPHQPLFTTQRIIDAFFPIARGGAACIPGPFGAGKTILQNLIARFSDADVVVVVACGERAGEVVEMMGEFGRLRDPRTGGALMDRTVILCNTSAMPVAAREASIHMGATIAEYYRHMGLSVLLLADSTSRWAQALRETSGRLEEIPGEEAYPAYLASEIKTFYERAGVVETPQGEGSLTIIGTVSPAGGNFEEPVTQATLSTVKCFLGLSAERAYRRAYPAIDPLLSWSRYREQIASALAEIAGADWAERIARALALLRRGEDIAQMMKVAGDEGVSLDDAVTLQKAQFLDAAFLQQDAFDAVDAAVPFPQQVAAFNRIDRALQAKLTFEDREAARTFFTRLTAAAKALNTAQPGTPEHQDRAERFDAILAERA